MNPTDTPLLDPIIESHIDAYEASRSVSSSVPLDEFLPDRADPRFLRIATELIRIDLELSFGDGIARSMEDYITLLPELEHDEELRSEIAFEEFRQRQAHGEPIAAVDLARKYDISTAGWSTVVKTDDRTRTMCSFADIAERVPSAGQRWRDFQIIREIGRGELSRVMLARQTSLSGREVVLKFAPKNQLEAEKLARLQDPHIVAVFSVYEDQDFHVFCMPYLGDKTLASCNALSEQEALRIVQKLAGALCHAHDRNILHNDIKPANVLMVDRQPMLLDFNLAVDAAGPNLDQVGGTLPYMSPESLRSLSDRQRLMDHRCDVFSLGTLLFFLLTGEQPFAAHADIADAIEARKTPRFELLSDVSPSTKSLLRKCLAFEPDARYQSATELLVDLERQSSHQSLRFAPNPSRVERLRKWCRRHPRLSSVSVMASVALATLAICLSAWMARERYVDRLEATAAFSSFQDEVNAITPELSGYGIDVVNIRSAIEQAEGTLAQYVASDGAWRESNRYTRLAAEQQREFDKHLSRFAFLTAAGHSQLGRNSKQHLQSALHWNEVSRLAAPEPRQSYLLQKAFLEQLAKDSDSVETLKQFQALPATDPTDVHFVGRIELYQGNPRKAFQYLEAACEAAPHDFLKWFDLAQVHVQLRQWVDAEHCFTTCLALQPDSDLARYCRAICRNELGRSSEAVEDFSDFLHNHEQRGETTEAALIQTHVVLLNRALAHKATGNMDAALYDLNQAIKLSGGGSRPLLIRSRVKRALGHFVGSAKDRSRALAATPVDELGWVSRGVAVMQRQPDKAIADFLQALQLNPRSHSARRNLAYVLSEKQDKVEEAIAWLDSLVKDYPHDAGSLGGRAVLLARCERFDDAMKDAKRIGEMDADPRAILQAACVYAMASKQDESRKRIAVDLLGIAFKADPKLARAAEVDKDLQGIREFQGFQDICQAAKRLAATPDSAAAVQGDN